MVLLCLEPEKLIYRGHRNGIALNCLDADGSAAGRSDTWIRRLPGLFPGDSHGPEGP